MTPLLLHAEAVLAAGGATLIWHHRFRRIRHPKGATVSKDLRDIIHKLHTQGFTTRTSKRGHVVVALNGVTVAVLAGTPSDWRSHLNGIARLRRAGFTPH